MSEIKVKAKQLPAIDRVLVDVLALTPPPTVKGRYALAKAAKALADALETFYEQHRNLLKKHAKKDSEGNPIENKKPNGTSTFPLEDEDAFKAEFKEMGEEEITLPGVRAITHDELGQCPITTEMEMVLLGNLLEDKDPG